LASRSLTPLVAAPTWALVRRLVREHVRPHLRSLAVAVGCMVIVAAATAGNAWLMKPVIDDVFIKADEQMLFVIAVAVFMLAVIKGTAGYLEDVRMEYVGQRVVADLQTRMYARLIHADLAFFHEHPTGTLISRFTNDANLLRHSSVRALTGLVKDALTLVFLVALMFAQDWLLGLISFVVFPAAVLPIVRIGRRIRKVSANTQAQMGEFTTILDETFQGARVVKAYGMEGYETARTRAIIDHIFALVWKAARVRSAVRPLMESLGGVAVTGVILYGGLQVIAGGTTAGTFFSFITALLLAYQPLKNIASLNTNLQEGLAAVQRLFAVIDTEPTIKDRPDARTLEKVAGAIRFEGVRFGYAPVELATSTPALDGVDIDIPAGRTVALVGPSGAGKSTILNLIPRFYDVQAGRVTVDGVDVREATLASLRGNIALVSQEITLFDDTVRANIAYGRLDATDAEIEEAARDAGAHDFISALPESYDTHVGSRGLKLSGGERQRLAIARAMLKNAPILLLDEATSSLDAETERQVQVALARLKHGRTTVVIAHRLSTVVNADLIFVIDAGRVVEIGAHRDLLAREGTYARLYALQFADQGETLRRQRAQA
jgi:subfamily B ATP-binding cassette protein MsbA